MKCQKLPSCRTDPVLAHSEDLPSTKAEPISDVDSASVITYLRKDNNPCTAAGKEE